MFKGPLICGVADSSLLVCTVWSSKAISFWFMVYEKILEGIFPVGLSAKRRKKTQFYGVGWYMWKKIREQNNRSEGWAKKYLKKKECIYYKALSTAKNWKKVLKLLLEIKGVNWQVWCYSDTGYAFRNKFYL